MVRCSTASALSVSKFCLFYQTRRHTIQKFWHSIKFVEVLQSQRDSSVSQIEWLRSQNFKLTTNYLKSLSLKSLRWFMFVEPDHNVFMLLANVLAAYDTYMREEPYSTRRWVLEILLWMHLLVSGLILLRWYCLPRARKLKRCNHDALRHEVVQYVVALKNADRRAQSECISYA